MAAAAAVVVDLTTLSEKLFDQCTDCDDLLCAMAGLWQLESEATIGEVQAYADIVSIFVSHFQTHYNSPTPTPTPTPRNANSKHQRKQPDNSKQAAA